MKRLQMFGGLLLIPALALFVAAPGCGKKEETKKPVTAPVVKEDGEEKKEDVAAKPPSKEVLKAGDGVIKGKVTFDGEMPKLATIEELVKHENCKMAPDGEKVDQSWLIGKDKGVANVVVYLKGKFEVSDADKKRPAASIDQPYCQFEPRVLALMSGQKLLILNSAKFPHNTRYTGEPGKNPSGSETIPPGEKREIAFKAQAKPVPLNCEFHKWMTASVWVFDHPYSAVTKADGTFEIKNVPTGAEVRLFAWHEAKQNFHGGAQGEAITLKPGETKQLDLKISK